MKKLAVLAVTAFAALAACGPAYPPYGPPPPYPGPGAPYPPYPPPMTPRPTAGLGQACGGFAGIQCRDAGAYCETAPQAQCGAADQTGVCALPPQFCTREYRPVCGCDGRTYSNSCEAAANRASVAYPGQCMDDAEKSL